MRRCRCAPSPTAPTSRLARCTGTSRRRCICWCRRWVGNSAASTRKPTAPRSPGPPPFQRLNFMVGKLNRAMQRNPLLTEAMTRAYVFADASAASEVDQVEKLIDSMFARAMANGEPTEDQYHIARVISDVWLSNLLAWLTRRASATDVSKRLDLAVRLLIGDQDSA